MTEEIRFGRPTWWIDYLHFKGRWATKTWCRRYRVRTWW